MANQKKLDWIETLYLKRQQLESRLQYLKHRLEESHHIPEPLKSRQEGEFHYLELPVRLDNTLKKLSGPISTTDITNMLVSDRALSKQTWVLVNRNVSRLLNSRVRMGLVRKVGRVKGSNRALLWEWIG